MAKLQNPVIVIPGITATSLYDQYPLQPHELWSMVLHANYERLSLHPDNLRYETAEPADVRVGQLFRIYDDFIDALRHDLSEKADRPTPVFAFPYDWRRDVADTAVELHDFIEEVIARTQLLRHYDGYADIQKVDLVGHSMGGLVICEYLSRYGSEKRVGKIATLGTPYLGSLEAVVKLVTGMGNLAGSKPSEREREVARSVQAIYQLLPSFDRAVIDSLGEPIDLFNPSNWQDSIVRSLAEFVRLHSVKDFKPVKRQRDRAAELLQEFLDKARAHRGTVTSLRLPAGGLESGNWLAIIGIGKPTRIQMTVGGLPQNPRFAINEDQYVDTWTDDDSSRRTGDSTVPLAGAIPPFLDESQPVCVAPEDFGFFEAEDRLLMGVAGLHAALPSMNLVQRLVLKHFRPTFGGDFKGRRVPGATQWNPPIDSLREA